MNQQISILNNILIHQYLLTTFSKEYKKNLVDLLVTDWVVKSRHLYNA